MNEKRKRERGEIWQWSSELQVHLRGQGRQYSKYEAQYYSHITPPQVVSWGEVSMVSYSSALSGLVKVPWPSNRGHASRRETLERPRTGVPLHMMRQGLMHLLLGSYVI